MIDCTGATHLTLSEDKNRVCIYSAAPVSFCLRNTMLNRLYVEISVYVDTKKIKGFPLGVETGTLTISFFLNGVVIHEVNNQEVIRVAVGSCRSRCDCRGNRVQLFWGDKAARGDFIAIELSSGKKIKLVPGVSVIETHLSIWEWYLWGVEENNEIAKSEVKTWV